MYGRMYLFELFNFRRNVLTYLGEVDRGWESVVEGMRDDVGENGSWRGGQREVKITGNGGSG